MNKKEIINAVAERMSITKKDAGELVGVVFDVVTEAIVEGNSVSIPGLGKFEVKEVGERTCRNPQTGEALVVPAHKAPKFKASKTLKDAVR